MTGFTIPEASRLSKGKLIESSQCQIGILTQADLSRRWGCGRVLSLNPEVSTDKCARFDRLTSISTPVETNNRDVFQQHQVHGDLNPR